MRLANILPGGGGWRKQETLLWQMDCATRLSVEILQLQNIPIIWNYLRDPTFTTLLIAAHRVARRICFQLYSCAYKKWVT